MLEPAPVWLRCYPGYPSGYAFLPGRCLIHRRRVGAPGRQVFCSTALQGSSFKSGFEPRRLFFCMQLAPIAGIFCTLERCCSSFPALLLPLQDSTLAHKANNDSGTGTPAYCPV